MKKIFFFIVILISVSAGSQGKKGFEIVEHKDQKQVDILYNGKLLTAYCYYDSVRKPFLFPVNTLDGITVTRGWPLVPRAGERTDHPHHVGIWQNYESVNGLDFWNNSTAIAPEKRNLYGTIVHTGVIGKTIGTKIGNEMAGLVTTADWVRPDGHVLIKETTVFDFTVKNGIFYIDREAHYEAQDLDVVFKDTKDGFLGMRVARELEMPSDQADVFTDVHGNKTTVPPAKSKEGVTGKYYNSDGVTGDSVWSTKGRWCMLKGKKDGKDITIGIFDNPSNIGYPTYWHARGYGLFAANPLGRKVFSNGKEELNYTLKPKSSVTFKYRIAIASKDLTADDMNKEADAFAKK